MSKSLIMLKPDAYDKKLPDVLRQHLAEINLVVVREKRITLNGTNVAEIWPKIYSLEAWYAYQQYLVGYPLEVWEVEGDDAVDKVTVMKKIVRDLYCESGDVMRKLIHTPDSITEYEFNVTYLFALEDA